MLQTVLHTARSAMGRQFMRFGLHCATHQIRVILISCVVITSLLYPALALYSTSHPKSVSILDAFNPRSAVSDHLDLVDLWAGHIALLAPLDGVSRAQCGLGRVVRVERVLINGGEDDALDHLLRTLELEQQIAEAISAHRIPCIKGRDDRCLVLSPLAFWNHDADTLRKDNNLLDTITSTNVPIPGFSDIPMTPEMVFAGRGSYEHHTDRPFEFASSLALTYFFPDTECSTKAGRLSWLERFSVFASQTTKITVQPQEPTLITLRYMSQSQKKEWTAFSAFLYLAYAFFFVIGLTFTALVEISVSTITSLSVCALVGFKVTMVPWEILPIMIVFVGAENMFNLVDAVTRTSITLSVKQRIAEGLSQAGTSNTLKVVSYNSILGVIAVFSVGAIRQFCVFAIVVLVAHWFLAHTFFLAVLSIDIQRLELEELLRQNAYNTPLIPPVKSPKVAGNPQSTWLSLGTTTRKQLSGRAGKNLSLLLLLAITALLYYATRPAYIDSNPYINFPRSRKNADTTAPDPAWQIWKTLNPNNDMLHLRVEMPIIVTLRPEGVDDTAHRFKFSLRVFRFLIWATKTLLFPIVSTTCALWALLLYLLKNTELLEAQRNRPGSETQETEQDETSLDQNISFSTLPRVFESDVELIATSRSGNIAISVGLQNEIVIWNIVTSSHVKIDASDVLLRSATTSSATFGLTCVAVDDNGTHCAVGTAAGVIAVWRIQDDKLLLLPHLSLHNSTTGVVDMQFTSPSLNNESPTTEPTFLVATYDNGVAAKWSVDGLGSVTLIKHSHNVPLDKAFLTHLMPDDRLLVALCGRDGSVELVNVENSPLIPSDVSLLAGNPEDLVSKAHVWRTTLGGETRVLVAAATDAGVISLWDALTGEYIVMLDDVFGKIGQLHLTEVRQETCHFCGNLPVDSFALSFSADHTVWFYKIFLPDENRRCSCTPTRPKRMPSFDSLSRRSRRNSVSSLSSSPQMLRNRLTSNSLETTPFPVSGHGVHSRRASEKDPRSRTSEMTLALPSDDCEPAYPTTLLEISKSTTASSFWQKIQILRIADASCERGSWGVFGNKIVGVRRRPRQPLHRRQNSASDPLAEGRGLSLATLERWELWTFDPSVCRLQNSTLASLPSDVTATSKSYVPRLPFTRVSPFIISRSRSLAGFGNTLGVFNFLDS